MNGANEMFLNTKKSMKMEKIITKIAQEKLDIETLEERKSDSLDFHEVSVWGLKAALEAAYQAGKESKF